MKKKISPTLSAVLASVATTATVLSIVLLFSYVYAAPTQAPPGGNPTFPLQGLPGSTGATGATGPQGPQGTAGGTNCRICMNVCDFNGSGPCSSTCANVNAGWSSWAAFYGDVDGNDVYRISLTC